MQELSFIQSKTGLPQKSVRQTLGLLRQDCTVPFLSRYRKEQTGNLDEVQLEAIVSAQQEYSQLEKRRETILSSIQEQGKLTAELKQEVTQAGSLTQLEDLYLPFKQKRKTKADAARELGFEPLAKIIMAQRTSDLNSVLHRFKSTKLNGEACFEQARLIMAEWVSERLDIRNYLRKQLHQYSQLQAKVVKSKKEEATLYKDYFDWDEPLNRIPSHRFLAIERGVNEGFLRRSLQVDKERVLRYAEEKMLRSSGESAQQIKKAIRDAYSRLLLPSLMRQALQEAKKKADAQAIEVFAENLKQLLLGSPLGEKRVLAIDPGFKTGCKLVCLGEQGDLLHNETIFPHAPQRDTKLSGKKINTLVESYKIDAIAIGNGTASRETDAFIRKLRFKKPVQVFVVSEAGASIYSASSIAREEFPNYDVTVRGAVSIGRRLQDPLAELVKIDAKSLGVGQYQHDVDQQQLKEALDRVVRNCVNAVGVNVNTASKALLSYVSGIGDKLAENMVMYRSENGAFTNRESLLQVPRIGAKAYQQSAGFLRIKNAEHPLDDSAVHPERYELVTQMAADVGLSVTDLIGNAEKLSAIDLSAYCSDDIGMLSLADILSELKKPGLDIRFEAKMFTFNQQIRKIDDVEAGQLLPGIVTNITNFGCFVDIGIKENGLIHVSNLADKFISDVTSVVRLQQQLIVEVLSVDVARKRIQLKLYKKMN